MWRFVKKITKNETSKDETRIHPMWEYNVQIIVTNMISENINLYKLKTPEIPWMIHR